MRPRWFVMGVLATLMGCDLQPQPDFTLKIVPDIWNRAFVGQKVVLLVTVEDEATDGATVTLTADAANCDVEVRTVGLVPGQVGEIVVTPGSMPSGTMVTAEVHGIRDGLENSARVNFEVIDEVDDLGPEAAALRDRFVVWLAANQPELGITDETTWDGTSVQHLLVVSHYLFFSDEWEMGVAWHIMIPPYDWTQVYLRRRFEEAAPSLAFQIDSRSDLGAEPHEIAPPEQVSR